MSSTTVQYLSELSNTAAAYSSGKVDLHMSSKEKNLVKVRLQNMMDTSLYHLEKI